MSIDHNYVWAYTVTENQHTPYLNMTIYHSNLVWWQKYLSKLRLFRVYRRKQGNETGSFHKKLFLTIR